jgi:hypothetical protein
MTKHLAGVVAALALLLARGSASGGPWTPEPGHGYAKIWVKWLPGLGYHAGDGSTIDYAAYHEILFTAYGEIGIVRSLAATLHLPIVNLFTLEDPRIGGTSAHASAGDPTLGLRWRFLKLGRFVAAVEGAVRFPLASGDPVQAVYATTAGNPRIGDLRVGTGVWDVIGVVSAGYGWDRVYTAASMGFIRRTGSFDDVLLWTAEGGVRISSRWSARARITRWHPLQNGSAPRHESPSGIGNGTSYLGLAAEADWRFSKRWMVGGTIEGGLGLVRRQTGGPVLSAYVATVF